jgi:hypothetical protein
MSCFLCNPDPALVYMESGSGRALCGLGPLTEGYSVVATRDHIRSAADALSLVPEFITFTESVRSQLTNMFGPTLLTEHGRLPVCIDHGEGADTHCFHAHFLLFPAAPSIAKGTAATFFGVSDDAISLADALQLAHTYDEEYFLFSPTAEQASIMRSAPTLPRQFARVLVADAQGRPAAADWRTYPSLESASRLAARLRSAFGTND